jgi:hypothetical protein
VSAPGESRVATGARFCGVAAVSWLVAVAETRGVGAAGTEAFGAIGCWSSYTGTRSPQSLRWLGARPGFGRVSAIKGPGGVWSYHDEGLWILPRVSVSSAGNWLAAIGPRRSCLKNVGCRSRLLWWGGCGLSTPTLM